MPVQPEHQLLKAFLLNECSSNINQIQNNKDSQELVR